MKNPIILERAGYRRAFSLMELLVTISIILTLGGIGASLYQSGLKKGQMVKELGAGKALINAYLTAAQEANGRLLPGYDRTISSMTLPDGTTAHGPAAQRYPYRLSPYLGDQLRGTILAGDNVKQINTKDNYVVSCYPSFGINYYFAGGDVNALGATTLPNECATRLAQVSKPSSLLVFATGGGYDSAGKVVNGYCILSPPKLMFPMWSSSPYKEGNPPGDYGGVDARHDGKALCVFLDGSIRSYKMEELRDMRLWNRNAAEQDNPNYQPSAF